MILFAACAPAPVVLPEAQPVGHDTGDPLEIPSGWTLVVDVGTEVEVGHPVASATAQGDVVVAWLAVQGSERSLWFAQERKAPFRVDDGNPPPIVASARDPGLSVVGSDVALVTGSSDGVTTTVDLWRWTVGDMPVETVLASSTEDDPVDQPEIIHDAAGRLLVAWKQEIGPTSTVWVGSDLTGFLPQAVTAFPGAACPCCPHFLLPLAGGDVALAVRTDVDNTREVHVARAAAGTTQFDLVAQATHSGWWIPACPFEGPELAELDETLLVTWSDGSSGDLVVWTGRSENGGASWSDDAPVAADAPWDQQSPRMLAVGSDLWVVTHQPDAVLWQSSDVGQTWTELQLPLPLARVALVDVQGKLKIVGTESGRRVWIGNL